MFIPYATIMSMSKYEEALTNSCTNTFLLGDLHSKYVSGVLFDTALFHLKKKTKVIVLMDSENTEYTESLTSYAESQKISSVNLEDLTDDQAEINLFVENTVLKKELILCPLPLSDVSSKLAISESKFLQELYKITEYSPSGLPDMEFVIIATNIQNKDTDNLYRLLNGSQRRNIHWFLQATGYNDLLAADMTHLLYNCSHLLYINHTTFTSTPEHLFISNLSGYKESNRSILASIKAKFRKQAPPYPRQPIVSVDQARQLNPDQMLELTRDGLGQVNLHDLTNKDTKVLSPSAKAVENKAEKAVRFMSRAFHKVQTLILTRDCYLECLRYSIYSLGMLYVLAAFFQILHHNTASWLNMIIPLLAVFSVFIPFLIPLISLLICWHATSQTSIFPPAVFPSMIRIAPLAVIISIALSFLYFLLLSDSKTRNMKLWEHILLVPILRVTTLFSASLCVCLPIGYAVFRLM